MCSGKRVVAVFTFLAVVIPGVASAARKGRLVGRLADPADNPIPGVTVTVTSPDIPSFHVVKTTDKRGIFIVDFSQIDVTYVYRFDKAGYQSLEARQAWSLEGTQNYEWKLQPADVQAPAGEVAPTSTSAPAVEAYNAGVAAVRAKAYEDALKQFTAATEHDPELRQAWAALAAVQLELGLDKEAAASSEKAISLGSTEEALLLVRWKAYTNLKDEVKAAEALKDLEASGRRAEEAKRLHNEGVAFTKAGDNASAFGKFQEALTLDPNLQESLLGLATAGLKIGKNAEAADAAETVLKSDPGNEKALRLRYNACLALGDRARLADALVGLAKVEPVAARDGLLQLGFDAYDKGDMDQARKRFLQVLSLDPNQPLAHFYLGIALVNAGSTADARTHLERFLELAPNNPEAESAREMLRALGKP